GVAIDAHDAVLRLAVLICSERDAHLGGSFVAVRSELAEFRFVEIDYRMLERVPRNTRAVNGWDRPAPRAASITGSLAACTSSAAVAQRKLFLCAG
ncbi:MAG: hypothetical protein ACRDPA_04145, partial [Solirubrobacteraceae bacterium]